MHRRTITFQPTEEVKSLLEKAINRRVEKSGKRGKRGVRSQLINGALRQAFADLIGKREGGVLP